MFPQLLHFMFDTIAFTDVITRLRAFGSRGGIVYFDGSTLTGFGLSLQAP
jgi:hypothetical protein